jgi:hypothetical protein
VATPLGKAEPGTDRCGVEAVQRGEEAVDHRVADEVHLRGVDALGGQVGERVRRGGEEDVRQGVGDDPVDLLGHLPVEGAQPSLHVRGRHVQLGADEDRGQRRVDVAVDDDQRRPLLRHHVLQPDQQGRRLAGVRAGTDGQVGDRLGETEVGEEDVRHQRVVVLAGVHDALPHARLGERAHHRGGLHEVGTRAEHVQDEGIAGALSSTRMGKVPH